MSDCDETDGYDETDEYDGTDEYNETEVRDSRKGGALNRVPRTKPRSPPRDGRYPLALPVIGHRVGLASQLIREILLQTGCRSGDELESMQLVIVTRPSACFRRG
jgi:hypothetical protein